MSDVEFLRGVFGPHDPARAVPTAQAARLAEVFDLRDVNSTETPLIGGTARRRHLAVAAAAAAVVVVALAGIWTAGAWHATTPATGSTGVPAGVSAGVSATASASLAPGYDHIRWQDWSGGKLLDVTDRWISSEGYGRITQTDADGVLASDLTIVPTAPAAPTGPSGAAIASRASAPATPAPSTGTVPQPIEYPGSVPSTQAALRAYLAADGSQADTARLGQRIVGLLFARTLSGQQQSELATIARTIAPHSPALSTTPTGEQVELVPLPPLPESSQWFLAVSPDDARVVGVCYDQGQQTWRLLLVSELTATTS